MELRYLSLALVIGSALAIENQVTDSSSDVYPRPGNGQQVWPVAKFAKSIDHIIPNDHRLSVISGGQIFECRKESLEFQDVSSSKSGRGTDFGEKMFSASLDNTAFHSLEDKVLACYRKNESQGCQIKCYLFGRLWNKDKWEEPERVRVDLGLKGAEPVADLTIKCTSYEKMDIVFTQDVSGKQGHLLIATSYPILPTAIERTNTPNSMCKSSKCSIYMPTLAAFQLTSLGNSWSLTMSGLSAQNRPLEFVLVSKFNSHIYLLFNDLNEGTIRLARVCWEERSLHLSSYTEFGIMLPNMLRGLKALVATPVLPAHDRIEFAYTTNGLLSNSSYRTVKIEQMKIEEIFKRAQRQCLIAIRGSEVDSTTEDCYYPTDIGQECILANENSSNLVLENGPDRPNRWKDGMVNFYYEKDYDRLTGFKGLNKIKGTTDGTVKVIDGLERTGYVIRELLTGPNYVQLSHDQSPISEVGAPDRRVTYSWWRGDLLARTSDNELHHVPLFSDRCYLSKNCADCLADQDRKCVWCHDECSLKQVCQDRSLQPTVSIQSSCSLQPDAPGGPLLTWAAIILFPLIIILIILVATATLMCFKRCKITRPLLKIRMDSKSRDYSPKTNIPSKSAHNLLRDLIRPKSSVQPRCDPATVELKIKLVGPQLLIDSEKLTCGHKIGEGYFGRVYKGYLKVEAKGQLIAVAIKTLKRKSDWVSYVDKRAFINEGLMMKNFDHENVLALIGVAFDGEGLPMVVTPFMQYADLHSYISDGLASPTVKELIEFGIQVARGMAYLAREKYVHRDLAARNCMLDEKLTVKVADFGLSRDIYGRDYYQLENTTTGRLPLKWMALESIEKSVYTSKSDVWSYGVLLWELMTRGVVPYPDVDNFDLYKYLKSGRRMLRPKYCPEALYQLMWSCWNENPTLRPTFDALVVFVPNVILILERASK